MKGTVLIYLVAHMQPVSAGGLAEYTGENVDSVGDGLRRAWRDGVLVRKNDPDSSGGRRYVYALAPLEEGGLE